MKKLSVYLSLVFLTISIIPSVVFASWWNPSTWFQKPEIQIVEKIVEKPVDKIVTKTVTIDNTDQAKQIKYLSDQITAFQKSVSDKDAEITDLKTKLENSSAYGKLVFKRYNEAKTAFEELENTAQDILNSYRECINEYSSASIPVVQNISVQLAPTPTPLTKDQYCQKYYFSGGMEFSTNDAEYCTGVKPVQR